MHRFCDALDEEDYIRLFLRIVPFPLRTGGIPARAGRQMRYRRWYIIGIAKDINTFAMDLSGIRKEYTRGGLNRRDVPPDPLILFEQWLATAVGAQEITEPTAMAVGTVSADCRPSIRTVLLKELRDGQFVFFTHYESRKGRQLAANPQVALSFLWYPLERQVHIEGTAERISPEESDAYFRSRPPGSRIGAAVSPQSQPIPGRAWLAEAYEAKLAEAESSDTPVERPEHWGGVAVTPVRIEFWQGRENRLHDRILYTRQDDGSWRIERLAP